MCAAVTYNLLSRIRFEFACNPVLGKLSPWTTEVITRCCTSVPYLDRFTTCMGEFILEEPHDGSKTLSRTLCSSPFSSSSPAPAVPLQCRHAFGVSRVFVGAHLTCQHSCVLARIRCACQRVQMPNSKQFCVPMRPVGAWILSVCLSVARTHLAMEFRQE